MSLLVSFLILYSAQTSPHPFSPEIKGEMFLPHAPRSGINYRKAGSTSCCGTVATALLICTQPPSSVGSGTKCSALRLPAT